MKAPNLKHMVVKTTLALLLSGATQAAEAPGTANVPVSSTSNVASDPALALKPGELRLNFRGAALQSVLQYLSEAAGFIIELHTDVRGKIDVWSAQPVTQDEALALIN